MSGSVIKILANKRQLAIGISFFPSYRFGLAVNGNSHIQDPGKNRSHFSLRSKRFRAVKEQRTRNDSHFSRGQNRESCYSVFLCSETTRKRLLRPTQASHTLKIKFP